MKEKIFEALFAQAREMGEESGQKELLDPTPETKLYHSHGTLDSLGLVGFITGAEEKIADAFGVDIILVDEKAMSQVNSPFTSIQSLADYIEKLITEESAA
jgi:acyl carrier protein